MAHNEIQTVHLVFKTHLDVGYTDYARNVVNKYFNTYIPQALDVAEQLRTRGGPERLTWTTGAWLIYEYLAQAGLNERARLEAAITRGDITWHGIPFTWWSEFLDPSLFAFGLSLSQELDRRYSKHTIAAKMTDVPAHTRSIVPLLAQADIQFLHIGVNPASTPPEVPPVFIWRDPASGTEILVMYHKGSYGDIAVVPGLPDVLAFAHTNDNLGPSNAEEVIAIHQNLRERFPRAYVVASTLDAFAVRLLTVKDRLPVITKELGDTWIHGAGTDPRKVAYFRELSRLRREWIKAGKDATTLKGFSLPLLLVAEHTWGLDEKVHLADTTHYDASSFQLARRDSKWKAFEASWAEQRAYIDQAITSLGDSAMAAEARARLADLEPRRPSKVSFIRASNTQQVFETDHFEVGFDPHGRIISLTTKSNRRAWANSIHPWAFIQYQTFSYADYDRFYHQYIINKKQVAFWALNDFTKPGIERANPESRIWPVELNAIYYRRAADATRFLLELTGLRSATEHYGCPQRFTVELSFPAAEPSIEIILQWFKKQACRLPEALWFGFKPITGRRPHWRLDKLGEWVSPLEVVRDGARHLHAVNQGVAYADARDRFTIDTLDTALVAPGQPSLLNFNNVLPAAKDGVNFNLYNNIWGTNHPMWYDEDTRFRFMVRF